MQSYSLNGFPENRTNYPYVPSPPVSAPPASPYPHVVGEGDVASITLPDGTLQLYFVPARTPACFGTNYQPWGVNPAWFIRTIPNIFPAPQPPALSQPNVPPNDHPFFHDIAEVKTGYPLQFHNDQTTSSTDMRYFCQPMETSTWHPKQSTETQVEQPVKLYDVVCCKACHCQYCHRLGRTETEQPTSMSVDGITERISTCYCNKGKNTVTFCEPAPNASGCECKSKKEKRQTSEKSNQSVRERATQPLNDGYSQTKKETCNCNDCEIDTCTCN